MDWQDTLFDSSADNTAQACKASGGYLYFLEVANIDGVDGFLQLFDSAVASVTVGATTPKLSILVPHGNGSNYGSMSRVFTPPLHFNTAITYAGTTTPTGNGAMTTPMILSLGFK